MHRAIGRLVVVSLLFVAVIPMPLLLTGCQPEAAARVVTPHPPLPVAIAVIDDKSGSANWTRTPPWTMAQIDALIAIVRRRAGELTYGTVTADSNRVLHRLTITAEPVAPVRPSTEGNPFAAREAMRAYRSAAAAYDAQQRAWKVDTDARIAAFRSEVEPLLSLPPNARRSDVLGAIARADLFLAEAAPGADRASYLLVVSDGVDNIHRPFPGLQSHATLLLVNGVGSVGSLADLKPLRFEAIDPAIRYLEHTK